MKKVLFLLLSITICFSCSYLPEELDEANNIEITETPDYIVLSPTDVASPSLGVLFYPGGLVAPHAYIEALQELVSLDKYKVVILKVSGNLAILNSGKAHRFKDDFEGVSDWIIGGHSLGGAVACIDVAAHPTAYRALFLMGAYSASDLSEWARPVVSFTAEFDMLSDSTAIAENAENLPPAFPLNTTLEFPIEGTGNQTLYYEIQGGNHAQFGSYGEQAGDGEATIDAATQQSEVRNLLRSFLEVNNL